MKTYRTTPNDIERSWFVVDAEGQILGRLASRVASILRGKHKPYFTTHLDTGDHVIVVNAAKIAVTGKKLDDKVYTRFTGHPGGLKSATLRERLNKQPEEVIRGAVKRMLPRGPLGRQMLRKLIVHAGADHPHQAQQPQPLDLNQE